MSIKIRCPTCQSVQSVHPRMMGRSVRCPKCEGTIVVPTAEAFQAALQERSSQHFPEVELSGGALDLQFRELERQPPSATRGNPKPSRHGAQGVQRAMEAQEKKLAAALTSFRRPKAAAQEDMDMTPMVDVTFLLLIFFMITASFSVQKSIQQPSQKSDQPSLKVQPNEEDKDMLVVQIDEFNAYNIVAAGADTPAGSKQDLIVRLTDLQSGQVAIERAMKLVVDAHENCLHSAVVDALDAGREAGFESFEVRTVEQFD